MTPEQGKTGKFFVKRGENITFSDDLIRIIIRWRNGEDLECMFAKKAPILDVVNVCLLKKHLSLM